MAARTYFEFYFYKVKLSVVVPLIIELIKFNVVLIATTKPDIKLRLELPLKWLTFTVMIIEDNLMLQFGITDWSTHKFDKNSKVIFIFGLPLYHF